MNNRTRFLLISAIAVLVIAAGVVALLFSQVGRSPSQTQTPQTPSTQNSSSETQAGTENDADNPIALNVYFSKHPESDDNPTRVFPVERTSPDSGVASYVIEQLLIGPTDAEEAAGYFSNVKVRSEASDCDGRDFTISITDRVATLRFCRTFDAIGSVSDGQAQEVIKASLLQFESIDEVVILGKDGNCQFDLSGENRCLM